MTSTTPGVVLAATQAALAAEHAAVYGYGVVGGLIDAPRGEAAREAYEAHRGMRDTLHRTVRELGGVPVTAAAGYELPFAVTDSESAVALAAELESRLAGVYADLVGAAEGDARVFAAASLRAVAVRAARWRGSGVPFPGLPEYDAGTGGNPKYTGGPKITGEGHD